MLGKVHMEARSPPLSFVEPSIPRLSQLSALVTSSQCPTPSSHDLFLIFFRPHVHVIADGKIFFDRRAASNLNLLTVNETAPDEV